MFQCSQIRNGAVCSPTEGPPLTSARLTSCSPTTCCNAGSAGEWFKGRYDEDNEPHPPQLACAAENNFFDKKLAKKGHSRASIILIKGLVPQTTPYIQKY